MKDEKEIQRKYMELQLMDSQIKQLQKQIQLADSQLEELESVSASLDDFGGISTGTEIIVPFAQGIYAKAELKNNEELIVNVGANVFAKKKIPETKKAVNSQLDDMRNLRGRMIADIKEMVTKAGSLQEELKKLASEKE